MTDQKPDTYGFRLAYREALKKGDPKPNRLKYGVGNNAARKIMWQERRALKGNSKK